MRKFRIFTAKTGAAALAASMLFQATAMAAPLDELNEIMEKQADMQQETLLEQFVGFSDLGKAIEENGLQFQLETSLLAETIAFMELDGEVEEGDSFNFNLQIDPELKKWMAGGGLEKAGESLFEMSLYGDQERLSLTMPQFFSGSLSMLAGNLREQYANSELALILGMMPEDIPDIDMTFYPDDETMQVFTELYSGSQDELTQKMEAMTEDLQMEKTEEGDTVIYTMTVEMSDIMEIYEILLDSYSSVLSDSGMLTVQDDDGTQMELDEMFAQLGSAYGESMDINFEVKDGLVQGFNYEIYIDTSVLEAEEEVLVEEIEDTLESAGTAEDATAGTLPADTEETELLMDSEEVLNEDFQGYLNYQISYIDPEDLSRGMDFHMTIMDEERNDLGNVMLGLYRDTDQDVTETYSMWMEITSGDGEVEYSGTPFTMTFDTSTGDLDALFSIEDGEDSVEMKLDSTFSEVEKGKSFLWTIDELSVSDGDEKMGISASVNVSADPGEMAAPEDERVLFDMTQAELLGLTTEITVNAETWAAQFAPEEEIDPEFSVDPEMSDAEAFDVQSGTAESDITETTETEITETEMAVTEAVSE